MNTTLSVIGCCNIVIGSCCLRKNGNKHNIIAYLNLILGLTCIIFSFTIFMNAE